jgi:hypothetical protein
MDGFNINILQEDASKAYRIVDNKRNAVSAKFT